MTNPEFKEFRIGDLFEIGTGSLIPSGQLVKGDIPRISAKSDNNGVLGYFDTAKIEGARHVENCITVNFFGSDGGIFYHAGKVSLEMKVHSLSISNHTMTKEEGVYIAAALSKSLKGYGYGNQLSSSKLKDGNMMVKLPVTTSGEPDFAYMADYIKQIQADYIKQIQADYIKQIQAYLQATGLTDTNLTEEERGALQGASQTKLFKLGDIFTVKSNPQLDKISFNFDTKKATYPYFTRSVLNNGIAGYVEYLDEEHKIKGNCLSVGMLGMEFFYMEKDFYAGQFTKHIRSIDFELTPKVALYFKSILDKANDLFKSVLIRDFEKVFNSYEVELPVVPDGELDLAYMETYIRATQKQVIDNLVKWNSDVASTILLFLLLKTYIP
jgi:hypothetical protein